MKCIKCKKEPLITNIVFCKECFKRLEKKQKGYNISERDIRDFIWKIEDFADRLQKDSQYYFKRANKLKEMLKGKKNTRVCNPNGSIIY